MYEKNNLLTHNVKLNDRNLVEISGINKIIRFNDEEFLLDSCMGEITIKGHSLEVVKINTEDGVVKIKGTIDCLIYNDKKGKNKEENFISRLFK